MCKYIISTIVFVSALSLTLVAHGEDKKSKKNTFTNSIGIKFRFISPGNFMMGSPQDEQNRNKDETQHLITLKKGYYIGVTEVTQHQWRKMMEKNPSEFQTNGDNFPVESVSWFDVQAFIRKLNDIESTDKYRLPTEAEWEYACRAGTTTPFAFGKCLSPNLANYDGRYSAINCPNGKFNKKTVPAATYPANDWGLYDMHGNVWEWCQDWYGKIYVNKATDPGGPLSGRYKVIRGGGWDFLDHDLRSANRDRSLPDRGLKHIGFRLVKSP